MEEVFDASLAKGNSFWERQNGQYWLQTKSLYPNLNSGSFVRLSSVCHGPCRNVSIELWGLSPQEDFLIIDSTIKY